MDITYLMFSKVHQRRYFNRFFNIIKFPLCSMYFFSFQEWVMYVIHIAEPIHIRSILFGCSISAMRRAKGASCYFDA